MDTAEAQKLAEDLLAEHGLDGWTFGWSNKRSAFGDCSVWNKRIRLSGPHVELNGADEVRETILHEIAHARCDPTEGHGDAWKATVQSIGGRPEATCGDEVNRPLDKYIGQCVVCGNTVTGNQRRDVSCADCSPGGYDPAIKLDWSLNPEAVETLVPEVVTGGRFDAHEAAAYVKARWAVGTEATLDAYRAMLDVGETLLKVKAYWQTKVNLEEWWRVYEIPFSQRWGNTLMRASQHRDAIVLELEAQIAEGVPNLKKALQVAEGKALPTGTQVPEPEADPETDGGLDADGDLVLRNPEPPEPEPKVRTPPERAVTLAEHIEATTDDVEGLVGWVDSFQPAELDAGDVAVLNGLADAADELATKCRLKADDAAEEAKAS
jgi:hypothetical protein